jgi:hypothetical protein
VVDAHIHLWDGRPENQRNIHGAQFINCFHDYHKALSPPDYLWPAEKFQHYGAETLYEDLFVNGYADMAICQPTCLKEFYERGFNTTEQNAELVEKYPDRIILNGAFDPRDGEAGLEALEALVETYGLQGASSTRRNGTAIPGATSSAIHGPSAISKRRKRSASRMSMSIRARPSCRSTRTPSTSPISTTRRPISPGSTSSSIMSACRASTISAGSRCRSPMSMAASPWPRPSSMRGRAISPR